MTEDLDTLVRRVDEDRWLASRFAPADVRRRLIALYAVNYEIARTSETVREPGLGDVRLEWWRSALEEIHQGRGTRSHPALDAYARAHAQTPFSFGLIEALIAARRTDWEPRPFATRAAFDDYVAATAGGLMRLAIEACGAVNADEATDRFVTRAGWLWGATGLLRAEAVLRTRGREVLPLAADRLARDAAEKFRDLKMAPGPRSDVFPAVGYVALVPGYLRALSQGQTNTPLLMRQLKLVAASATGRF
ncbi:MAG: squalene/phytoene synthase family protein [Hyphomonadaceae bacterium]